MSNLIIIGTGPGGYKAAGYAAEKGLTVTIFEAKRLGGTCLNEGCIPTKTLCHAADIILDIRKGEPFGIKADYEFSLETLMEKKENVVNQLRGNVETLMNAPGITLIHAKATIKDKHTVIADGKEYNADNIIIATGSTCAFPPVDGIHNENVLTSTEMLSLKEVPKNLCIIGAGVIGMEIASAFNAFGSDVSVVEYLKECLPTVDADIAKRLRKILEKRGIKFYLQSEVKAITNDGVEFAQKDETCSMMADKILVATGRRPDLDGLGLDNPGIAYNRKGIEVNDNMQTNIPNIYAIGDVNGKMMLAHAASAQGVRAVRHILGISDNLKFNIVPSAVFTNPEIGCVGMTEEQLKEHHIDYSCHKSLYRANGKALSMGENDGIMKMFINDKGYIIGCQIMGPHAADLTQEVAVLMNEDATVDTLYNIIHTHPTLSEVLQN